MSLELIRSAADEPITLAEAKNFLKVDTGDDDGLVAEMITAARIRAEWHTGRALTPQSWTLWLDAWPDGGLVELPLPPLKAVTAVTFHAPDARVLAADQYQVDAISVPARLKLGGAAPGALRALNAIAIAFDAGSDTLAPPLRQAILRITAFLYEHRGEAPDGLPTEALALLAPYRVLRF